MQRIRHDLRLSETVTPFGVGAVVDIRGESLIAPDTSWWDKRFAPEVHCERLVERLGPCVLREAPTHSGRAGKDTAGLLYWRFPTWRFCERCSALSQRSGKDRGKWTNKCECGGMLIPMRYVAVCEKGSHLQDVPWFMWAHRGHDAGVTEAVRFCRAYKELRFVRASKAGEGLRSLRVECGGCRRSRPLSELVMKEALTRDGIKCRGVQPWQEPLPGNICEHHLVGVQRGATGNYIAERISALDIPEEKPMAVALADAVRAHSDFSRVVADNGGPKAEMIAGWIADELGASVDYVLSLAASVDEQSHDDVLADLKDGEWAAFQSKLKEPGRDLSEGDFVVDAWSTAEQPHVPATLAARLTAVGQVRRVREVRALKGFRRYSADADLIPADLSIEGRRKPTFPAIEMFGEGIFLQFDEQFLESWEQHVEVRRRAGILVQRRTETPWGDRLDVPEARYVALHTIAHLLIRRLAYASGYSSASLQERIYARTDRSDPTAGILVYTAAGDAQGTLGGLVRLGDPERLVPLVLAALDDADVCSNDPVCIESDRQGASSLNLSACHGCSLVSETSCETANRLLDRQLVLGGRDVPGLLEGVLTEIRGGTSC
ncbi:hypothetical protein GCM10009721_11790 [Terrabacter tumescens]|uniref:MrfA-like Zn-binding domain-containing protein n=1 Tax=Terrabacter tumescens TaxID=60443 RepID=A0ABQ2HSA8_9MICO|nr:DUF1998 domain-containing protein [Terrabacter tumescens]GGM88388.1 hypothetical protein GCM10009721_11790 [Terrabacter tumescens]